MLDEQSQNAYLNLINALLTCPNGQEAESLLNKLGEIWDKAA